ncbi:membrane-associated guanylate kinase: WW and PDZ domain-containing protein 1-like protein [Leptotrombidium deliense]|uniref:Membrane-associated guanylate kinase: WW and PDZ domain-containing protein 1-like protein n=1 Tax=Leptotrombidium deliense TaxID=299467 RepID=A0A443SSY4_9ACAR|nr:membrane-associated guanylate kinase: WW and PDZ domain-containing protein 1-like protein [Leptotrombidium deliense]
MVDLGGYVIVLVEQKGKIKLFGSAAERNDCDEILEINGKNLENATHQQIIQHVHQVCSQILLHFNRSVKL